MRSICGSTLRRTLPLAALVLACTNPTSARAPTAVFVLRSIGGDAVPATIVLGGAPYTMVADTLFVDPPNAADGAGVLRHSVAAAYPPALPTFKRGAHNFIWRGTDLSVFFDCQTEQPCLAIFAYHNGVINGRELRFPAGGPYNPERVYERVQ